jgi:hypothetical protein
MQEMESLVRLVEISFIRLVGLDWFVLKQDESGQFSVVSTIFHFIEAITR